MSEPDPTPPDDGGPDAPPRVRPPFSPDRPGTYRDVADAAADAGLPYWLVLGFAGAIATLGLALNSAAVVIGAMLVAPLLSPVLGLGLALAVGDGRLAVQTLATIALSTLAVVAIGAVLTAALPYHDVTAEIAARTRPTLLDLGVAVFSGAAGALVSVARGSRFAGAGAGVAVSVALVPPLAAAGFGVGVGWNGAVVGGSLLLYGANLGGIVLSAVAVFLVAGMHRPEVLDAVRGWHRAPRQRGLAAWVERQAGSRQAAIFRAPWARVSLVLAFVGVVAFPLTASLGVIARETRVARAVDAAADVFTDPGHSFVLGREVELGEGGARVYLRVATEAWFEDADRAEFERRATAQAGEPVEVVLEQLPAAGRDLGGLAALVGAGGAPSAPLGVPPAPRAVQAAPLPLAQLLEGVDDRVGAALAGLALPDSTVLLGHSLEVRTGGTLRLVVPYAAPAPLSDGVADLVGRQARQALGPAPVETTLRFAASTRPRRLDPATLAEVGAALAEAPLLEVRIAAGPDARGATADGAVRRLVGLGVAAGRIAVGDGTRPGLYASLGRWGGRPTAGATRR